MESSRTSSTDDHFRRLIRDAADGRDFVVAWHVRAMSNATDITRRSSSVGMSRRRNALLASLWEQLPRLQAQLECRGCERRVQVPRWAVTQADGPTGARREVVWRDLTDIAESGPPARAGFAGRCCPSAQSAAAGFHVVVLARMTLGGSAIEVYCLDAYLTGGARSGHGTKEDGRESTSRTRSVEPR